MGPFKLSARKGTGALGFIVVVCDRNLKVSEQANRLRDFALKTVNSGNLF